jgi:hypothetical protein
VSDGKNRTPPLDPWTYPFDDMAGYVVRNQPLADATCGAMGRYAARYVAHYTAGGHTDECGVFHPSGLFYNWPHLSVLNENEYNTPPGDGVVYTLCWDAWKREIAKVNPNLQLVGPEIAMGGGASVGGGEWRCEQISRACEPVRAHARTCSLGCVLRTRAHLPTYLPLPASLRARARARSLGCVLCTRTHLPTYLPLPAQTRPIS